MAIKSKMNADTITDGTVETQSIYSTFASVVSLLTPVETAHFICKVLQNFTSHLIQGNTVAVKRYNSD